MRHGWDPPGPIAWLTLGLSHPLQMAPKLPQA